MGAIPPFRKEAEGTTGLRRVCRRFTLLQSAWTPYQSLPQTRCKPLALTIPEC